MAVPPPGSSALKACATPAESFAGRSGNSTFASESNTTMVLRLSGCRRPIALTVACLAMSTRDVAALLRRRADELLGPQPRAPLHPFPPPAPHHARNPPRAAP